MNINKGSIETMIMDVNDVLGTLVTLPVNTRYHVYDTDDNPIVVDQIPTLSNLRALCLIDSSLGGFVKGGDYDLFLTFTQAPDSPKLGPARFRIV